MSGDILQLKEQIASTETIDVAAVDAMNRLAALYFESNPLESYEISCRSINEAHKLGYIEGEAVALLHAGMASSSQRNYAEAEDFYLRSLKLREQLGDTEHIATINAKLGNIKLYEGSYNDALGYYNEAIAIRTILNDEIGIADLNTNSGIIHGFLSNYALAIKSHLLALNTYEKLGQESRMASAAMNIGLIYSEQQNYEDALKMYERALVVRRGNNEIKAVADLLNNIGIVHFEQHRYHDALEVYQQSLELRNQMGDKAKIASSYSNLGNVYRAQGNTDEALDYYMHALNLFTIVNEKRGLMQSYNNLGELYFETKNFPEAHKYLDIAVRLGKETGLKNPLRKSYEFLTSVYEQEGFYREAYNTHKLYTQLDKEIQNSETSKQIAQMTLRYEIEQKEQAAEAERIKNAELTKAFLSLEQEKKRSEELLNNILPEEISQELKEYGKTKARSFESATVLFADIQGFTSISTQLSAEDIVSSIDEYFEAFDRVVEKHGIEKIKTIGDAYLCVGGIPVATQNHAEAVLQTAKDFLAEVERLKLSRSAEGKHTFEFRLGIHTGPVVAGIVGIKKFAYDIWGDTVNTASRLQQYSEPNRINISEHTFRLIEDKFACTYRGEIEAKNKGKLKMYFVE